MTSTKNADMQTVTIQNTGKAMNHAPNFADFAANTARIANRATDIFFCVFTG